LSALFAEYEGHRLPARRRRLQAAASTKTAAV
jgi:hypothetical protein